MSETLLIAVRYTIHRVPFSRTIVHLNSGQRVSKRNE